MEFVIASAIPLKENTGNCCNSIMVRLTLYIDVSVNWYGIQGDLSIKDTLGPDILSTVESSRLSTLQTWKMHLHYGHSVLLVPKNVSFVRG